jgi:hypothetical protein
MVFQVDAKQPRQPLAHARQRQLLQQRLPNVAARRGMVVWAEHAERAGRQRLGCLPARQQQRDAAHQ